MSLRTDCEQLPVVFAESPATTARFRLTLVALAVIT